MFLTFYFYFVDRNKQEMMNTIINRLIDSCSDLIKLHKLLKIIKMLSNNRNLEYKIKYKEKISVVDIERIFSYQFYKRDLYKL